MLPMWLVLYPKMMMSIIWLSAILISIEIDCYDFTSKSYQILRLHKNTNFPNPAHRPTTGNVRVQQHRQRTMPKTLRTREEMMWRREKLTVQKTSPTVIKHFNFKYFVQYLQRRTRIDPIWMRIRMEIKSELGSDADCLCWIKILQFFIFSKFTILQFLISKFCAVLIP